MSCPDFDNKKIEIANITIDRFREHPDYYWNCVIGAHQALHCLESRLAKIYCMRTVL